MTVALWGTGCQRIADRAYYNAYYSVWEKLGREKRDLLTSQLRKAVGEEEDLKEEFSDTLKKIREEYPFEEGRAAEVYDALAGDYENAREKSDALTKRLTAVRTIAADLFYEWKSEARQITDAGLRSKSQAQLKQSQEQFRMTNTHFEAAERQIQGVLQQLRNHVLFAKHNLNANAIAGLEQRLQTTEPEIENLLRKIQESIEAAERFEKQLTTPHS